MTPSELFSLLSDETRLRILALLYQEEKLCVCEISQTIGSIQPKVSRHLSLMRRSELILDQRKGQWVYYRLNENLSDWIKNIIKSTLENLIDQEPYHSDRKKISILKKENICDL